MPTEVQRSEPAKPGDHSWSSASDRGPPYQTTSSCRGGKDPHQNITLPLDCLELLNNLKNIDWKRPAQTANQFLLPWPPPPATREHPELLKLRPGLIDYAGSMSMTLSSLLSSTNCRTSSQQLGYVLPREQSLACVRYTKADHSCSRRFKTR